MRRCAVLLGLLGAACAGTPGTPIDGAAMADAGPAIADPLPPSAPPALPIMTPCPTGWRTVSLAGGPDVCEPWQEDRAPDCAATELAIPGVGCQAIDTCPADGWPTGLPATGVVYVRAGVTSGDGSRAAPFATIPEGLAAAPTLHATTMALAVGEYDIGGVFFGVDLIGACASGTIVHDPSTDTGSAALLGEGHVHFEGVHAIGGFRGLWLYQDAVVTARDVILEGPFAGLRLDSRSSFVGDRVRIVGSSTPSLDSYSPFAVWMRPHSSVTLRSSTVIGGARAGFGTWAGDGDPVPMLATVTIEDSAVLDSIEGIAGPLGDLTVHRCAFERLTFGLDTWETTTTEIADLRLRDLSFFAGSSDFGSDGILAAGTVHASRVYVSRYQGAGVQSGRTGALSTFTDLVITDTSTAPEAPFAMLAEQEGELDVSRVYLGQLSGLGLRADGHAIIQAEDVTVNGVAALGGAGEAFSAFGGTITVTRAHATGFSRALATSFTSDASVTLVDVDADTGGAGVVVECVPGTSMACDGAPAFLSATRLRMRAIEAVGIDVLQARASLVDVDVDGVASTGMFGAISGIGLYASGAVDAQRLRIRNTTLQAIFVENDGATLTASDVRLETTHAVCTDAACASNIGGDGVACAQGGTITIDRFDVSGAARGGLTDVDACAAMTMSNGRVHDNEIGVLTDETLPTPTLSAVRVEANATDFNTTDVTISVTPPALP